MGRGKELVLVANPHLEELLEGGLGSLTTSPLLPAQLRLHLTTLPLRPGTVASFTVVGVVPLPTATLHSLTITVTLREEAVEVEARVEEQGLVAGFLVERAGVYLVAATLASQHVQGSPLAIPVLQDPATLATLGIVARAGFLEVEGKEHQRIAQNKKEQDHLEDGGELKKEAQERRELEKEAKEKKAQDQKDQEAHQKKEQEKKEQKRDQEARDQKIALKKKEQEKFAQEKKGEEKSRQEKKDQEKKAQTKMDQEKALNQRDQENVAECGSEAGGGLAPGRRCFVRHEGAWHGGLVHQVVHAGLVTVRNLTLGQYRGVGPGELVLAVGDIPRGQELATSARELQRELEEEENEKRGKAKALEKKLLEKKALGIKLQEKKEQERKSQVKKEQERKAREVKEQEERKVKEAQKQNKKAQEIKEQKRMAQQMKEQEKKAQEETKEKGGLTKPVSSGKWCVGSSCVARWSEDEVWYRAEVVAVAATTCTVLFTDYGNEAEVMEDDVVAAANELPVDADIDVNLEEEERRGVTRVAWAEGEECVARQEADGVWYRATVLQVLDQGDTMVLFKDYGTEAVVGRGEVVREAAEVPKGEPRDHHVVEEVAWAVGRLVEGEACVACWSDGLWYQAVVEEVQEGGAVVLFTDYGNSDFVPWEQVGHFSFNFYRAGHFTGYIQIWLCID